MKKITATALIALGTAFSAHAADSPVGCTYDQYGRITDGSTLWTTTTQNIASMPPFETNCLIDQFSYNNFYYLVSNDQDGNPRFMSLLPWYELFPSKGAPVWSGKYAPLNATQLNQLNNKIQAGDDYELLDVDNQSTRYDIRVNQVFYDYVNTSKTYQQSTLNTLAAQFNQNSAANGIWLPPTSIGDKSLGAIEIKTSWRAFGKKDDKLCPADLMHCETDGDNNVWGLVGFHLVQKTNTHGELVWATFEHIANSPDCAAGNANGIAQYPADPSHPGGTVNVNKNYQGKVRDTGWNYFDYGNYKTLGGDGKTCVFPTQNGTAKPICLTSPIGDKPGTWKRVEICRTDALANASGACVKLGQEPNSQDIACLSNSLETHFPKGLADKWKYYQLVGMEWAVNGNTEGGGFPVGCFTLDGAGESGQCPNYKGGGESGGAPQYTRAGSTTMANTTLETWMQNGIYLNVPGGPLTQADCFACHQPQTIAQPAKDKAKAFNQGDMSHIFSRVAQ